MAMDQDEFVRTGLQTITPTTIPPEETDCSICLEELKLNVQKVEDQVVQIRKCDHAFHRRCLHSWLKSEQCKHNTCPNCRISLFIRYRPLNNARGLDLRTSREAQPRPTMQLQSSSSIMRANYNRRYVERALRTIDGFDALPACLAPDSTTGEYVSIENRWRSYQDQELRRLMPSINPERANRILDDAWDNRTPFLRDLVRLEALRAIWGPQIGQERGARGIPALAELTGNQSLVDYGILIDTVVPMRPVENPNAPTFTEFTHARLVNEARLFSIFTGGEEQQYRRSLEQVLGTSTLLDPGTQDRIIDRWIRDRRLAHFVRLGVYRSYIQDGPPDTYTSWADRNATSAGVDLHSRPRAVIRRRLESDREVAAPVEHLRRQSTILLAPHAPTTQIPPYTPQLRRNIQATDSPPTTPGGWILQRSPFRSPVDEAISLGVSWFNGMPRGHHATRLLDPEYLRFWRERDSSYRDDAAAIARVGLYHEGGQDRASPTNAIEALRAGRGTSELPHQMWALPDTPSYSAEQTVGLDAASYDDIALENDSRRGANIDPFPPSSNASITHPHDPERELQDEAETVIGVDQGQVSLENEHSVEEEDASVPGRRRRVSTI